MRFLIVDDDESIHLYLRPMLTSYAACDCVFKGEEAIAAFENAYAEKAPYDAVFMDILMPGMDGHQTAGFMRDREHDWGVTRREQFKLVMITSLVDDMSVSRAFFNTEATCYIVKPLKKTKVLDELKNNLII